LSAPAAIRQGRRCGVFDAWTDPQQVVQWWGPRGFTTTTAKMGVRRGGVWRFVMHGPDGRDYQNKITYLEVMKPERLVYKHGGDEDLEPVSFQTTVTFVAQGNKMPGFRLLDQARAFPALVWQRAARCSPARSTFAWAAPIASSRAGRMADSTRCTACIARSLRPRGSRSPRAISREGFTSHEALVSMTFEERDGPCC
jgi:uncharacterized protein YndB with AHSA1/START domain